MTLLTALVIVCSLVLDKAGSLKLREGTLLGLQLGAHEQLKASVRLTVECLTAVKGLAFWE
jgi:hypothetical protein